MLGVSMRAPGAIVEIGYDGRYLGKGNSAMDVFGLEIWDEMKRWKDEVAGEEIVRSL